MCCSHVQSLMRAHSFVRKKSSDIVGFRHHSCSLCSCCSCHAVAHRVDSSKVLVDHSKSFAACLWGFSWFHGFNTHTLTTDLQVSQHRLSNCGDTSVSSYFARELFYSTHVANETIMYSTMVHSKKLRSHHLRAMVAFIAANASMICEPFVVHLLSTMLSHLPSTNSQCGEDESEHYTLAMIFSPIGLQVAVGNLDFLGNNRAMLPAASAPFSCPIISWIATHRAEVRFQKR